jgi:hypothetical protein
LDYELVLKLFRALREHEVEYVVVGAVAMGLHGLARGTQDLDLFIKPTADNVARLRSALSDVWSDPAIAEIDASELSGEIGVVRYTPPTGELTVDLIVRIGEAFRFEDIEWQEVDGGGTLVRVATPRMLIRMKRGTVRLQDAADAHAIEQRFPAEGE